MSKKAAGFGDNASQQVQEQSANYGVVEMSGYAAETRPSPIYLPQSWVQTNLGSVINYGKVEKAEPNNISDDTWILELEDIEKDSSKIIQRLNFLDRQSKSTKNRFKKGDVLYGKLRPYLNKVVMADSDGVCTTEIVPLSGGACLHNRYLFYWLKHPDFLAYVREVGYGVNMPRLGTQEGVAAPFVLAPLAEQQQIAAKLDELLAQVDSVKTRLDAIPKILKRFRQSVLAAAVNGKLTEDWRKVNSITQSDFDIYPTGDNVPIIWRRVPLGKYVENWDNDRVPVSSTERENLKGVYPYYGASGQIDTINGYTHDGDFVLIGEDGANLVARTKPIAFSTCGKIWVNNHAHVLRCKDGYENKYVEYFINALDLTPWVSGSAQPKLNQKNMNQIPISVPPKEEQTEIVNRVEQLLAYADQIEQRVKDAQARVNHLTQAILAKAFRGELTADWRAQNPELISGENSAEALLQRIKAEREAGGTSRKSKKV